MLRKLALAAALVLAGSATAQAASSFNVALDGFCNTFTLTVDGMDIYGTRGGCGYTDIDGGTSAKVGTTPYRITNDTNDGTILFTWYFTKPKHKAGDWYLYGSDGNSQTLYNSGTYTQSKAAPKGAGKDVTAGLSHKR